MSLQSPPDIAAEPGIYDRSKPFLAWPKTPVLARNLIRKLRGGSQAHLIEAHDGALYVVKFINNPQHRRVLVNEWLASELLRFLHIYVPETVAIQLTPDFIVRSPELYVTIGSRREAVPPGLHFGSKMAVHPDRVAVFDFLPDKLLGQLKNSSDFLGTLVFDKWVCNADSRQAVFFRGRAPHWTSLNGERSARVGFFAQMIDHGFVFNGPQWLLQDSPIQGPYFRNLVYQDVRSLDSFQPWLDMVSSFPVEVIDSAWKGIPRDWLAGDEAELERLLDGLMKRRARTPDLIEELHRHRPKVFPNWNQK